MYATIFSILLSLFLETGYKVLGGVSVVFIPLIYFSYEIEKEMSIKKGIIRALHQR